LQKKLHVFDVFTLLCVLFVLPVSAGTYTLTSIASKLTCSIPSLNTNTVNNSPTSSQITTPWIGDNGQPPDASATYIYTFKWNTRYTGEQPPKMAIAEEVGSAQWVDFNDDTDSGSASDGIGDSEIDTEPHTGLFEGLSSGTHYVPVTPNDDGSVTVKISQSASASTAVQLSINVPSVTPVEVDVSGVTVDSSGGLNALVGQGITASLASPPPGCTYPGYTWGVGGDMVAGFFVSPAAYILGVQVISPAIQGYPLQIDSSYWTTTDAPHWYWSDNGSNWGSSTAENVVVIAYLYDPNGNLITGVGAGKPVNLWAPSASIDPANTITSPSSYMTTVLGAINGVTSKNTYTGDPGVHFSLDICVPTIFSNNDQTPGTANSVQLVSWCTDPDNLPPLELNTDGDFYLDNQYPYGDKLVVAPSIAASNYDIQCTHEDSPRIGLALDTTSFNVANFFRDYFMYQPPGTDSIMVPLWETDWIWSASGSGSSAAFTPNPPGKTTIMSSKYTTTFPSWNSLLNTGSSDD
jgi:hypothetical protein